MKRKSLLLSTISLISLSILGMKLSQERSENDFVVSRNKPIEITQLTKEVPNQYKDVVIDFASKITLKQLARKIYSLVKLTTYDNNELYTIANIVALADYFKFTPERSGRYIVLTSEDKMRGRRSIDTLKTSVDPKKLVYNYKIHLMPQNRMLALINLMKMIDDNPEIQDSIESFKVLFSKENRAIGQSGQKEIFPLIVIYPASNKQSVQNVLNMVYKKLKDIEGTGQKPRHNEKITDLIFVGQGDGDFKGDSYRKYYQEDLEGNRIYYSDEFNRAGGNSDYKLNNPEELELEEEFYIMPDSEDEDSEGFILVPK